MFNLKTNWEKSRLLAKNLKINEYAKTGVSDGQLVRYVIFAGRTVNRPSTEILSAAAQNPEALGGIARLKTELPGLDWSRF